MLAAVGPMEVLVVVWIAAWLFLSYKVAKWAARKGYSFALFFVIAVLISFVLAFVIVIFLPDKVAPLSADERLAKLDQLHQGGVLNAAEYAEEKAKIVRPSPG
jgi:hypothetical protein